MEDNLISKIQKYLRPATVIIICLYGFYLRLASRAGGKLWIDELTQIDIMSGSFKSFLESIPRIEECSYLAGDYYLIYPFFKIFGYNKWGIALPHMITTILGFYLLYLISKCYFKTICGYLITFILVCFNPTLIMHSLEIRPYAVLPTLSLACFYFVSKLVEENVNLSLKKRWAIGAFFILTVWFHVYGIVMLFCSVGFCLLMKLRDKSFNIILKDILKLLFVVFALAMPLWIFSVFGPHGAIPEYDTFQYIPNPFKSSIGFLKAIFANLIGYRFEQLYFLLVGVTFPFLIPYERRLEQINFLMLMIFLPLGLILLADIKNSYWFIQRQFIWVMPWFAFFLGWAWDSFICYIGRKSTVLTKLER